MYFSKRIPEPKKMGNLEFKVFEQETKKNYRRWIVPLADNALALINRPKIGKILDVGCGPGLLAKEFAQRSKKFQIVGIDISSYAIKQAKKNCKGLNIVFKKAEASRLPFNNETFDLVISKDSLHHFNNLKQMLREAHRVTKPGGIVYLQDLRRDLPWYLLKMVIPPKNLFQKLQYYSARAAYTKKELAGILNKLGLKHHTIKTRKVTRQIRGNYNKSGINFDQLRASFQSRYVAVIKKS